MSKDTIYREDAIRALKSMISDDINTSILFFWQNQTIGRVIDKIKNLPSADRPQGWIPCSERLPKDEGIFLVTMETYVFNEYSHPVGTSFYSPSFGWVNAGPNKVLAWMPLPEPWKGADDDTI